MHRLVFYVSYYNQLLLSAVIITRPKWAVDIDMSMAVDVGIHCTNRIIYVIIYDQVRYSIFFVVSKSAHNNSAACWLTGYLEY